MRDTTKIRSTSRRRFLQAGIAIGGASLTSSALPVTTANINSPKSSRDNARKPNLLFIYTEGQRWDALSAAGNKLLTTPNMNRIGREGVVFNKSFCTNALCAPSRAVAMTGMYSHSTGALDNDTVEALPADIPLFTDLLHNAGYQVAFCGKAHIGNGARERYWDYYFGFNDAVTNYYNPRFFERRSKGRGVEATYPGCYADDLATDRALSWLTEEREQPFCSTLCHQSPHAPFYRPKKYLDLYNGTPIPVPPTFGDYAERYPGKPRAFMEARNKIGIMETSDGIRSLEELVKDYYAGVIGVDDNIGRVMGYLEQSGILDDTVILFSSDHGYFLGEWQAFDKRFMHEPSIHVPTMLRYPREFKAGTKIDEMVLNLDIAPTLLELAGVDIPNRMQGRSFVKLAKGQENDWRKDWLYEYFEYPRYEHVPPHWGIRTDRYKLIHYYLEPQEFEMYDLQEDPLELYNLYGNKNWVSVQNHLLARLENLRRETGAENFVRVLSS